MKVDQAGEGGDQAFLLGACHFIWGMPDATEGEILQLGEASERTHIDASPNQAQTSEGRQGSEEAPVELPG